MGANRESFSHPAIRVIHGESFVEFYQLIFNYEFLFLNHNNLISVFLLIQSNTEYGTASAIAFNKDPDALGFLFHCL